MDEPRLEVRRPVRDPARRAVAVAERGSERALAATAHAAIGFGLVGVGFLVSLAITGVIWLVGKKSPYVQAHADRAGRYQLLVLAVNIVAVGLWVGGVLLFADLGGWHGWTAGGWRLGAWALLGLVLLLAVPVFLAWYFGTLAYGLYAAARVLGGHDFRYRGRNSPFVGAGPRAGPRSPCRPPAPVPARLPGRPPYRWLPCLPGVLTHPPDLQAHGL